MRRTTWQELSDEGGSYAAHDDYVAACDVYVVAADAALEAGNASMAWILRVVARRMHVIAWARQKIDPGITADDVSPDQPRRGESWDTTMKREVTTFYVREPFTGDRIVVRVDRRGRVRRVRRIP